MLLKHYLNRILGTSGAFVQLKTSVSKAFHAKSFKLFWRNWNPLYGYMLSKYVNRPVFNMTNGTISSMVTFIFSGLILHDLWVMPLIYMVSGKILFFPVTIIFFCYWIMMALENAFNLRKQVSNDKIHVLINVCYLVCGSAVGGLISALF
jgi:hypothetical protein